MTYKDIEVSRRYKREWRRRNKDKLNKKLSDSRKKKRDEFFYGKVCKECGSNENLQNHHVDPSKKKFNIRWDMTKENFDKEIKKCIILCQSCHWQIHREIGVKRGEKAFSAKLINAQVVEIKKRSRSGIKQSLIAKDFDVTQATISMIVNGKRWSHVKI